MPPLFLPFPCFSNRHFLSSLSPFSFQPSHQPADPLLPFPLSARAAPLPSTPPPPPPDPVRLFFPPLRPLPFPSNQSRPLPFPSNRSLAPPTSLPLHPPLALPCCPPTPPRPILPFHFHRKAPTPFTTPPSPHPSHAQSTARPPSKVLSKADAPPPPSATPHPPLASQPVRYTHHKPSRSPLRPRP